MWRALFYARELNQIRYEGSYKHRTMYDERELRERLESLQDFTSDTEGSWTEIADRVSYTIARALIRSQDDLEERHQESLTLGEALEARSGKAVPLRIREVVGTLKGITTALRSLRRLALGLNVTDMDTAMGSISMLRVRWGRLLAFVDEKSDWIHAMVAGSRLPSPPHPSNLHFWISKATSQNKSSPFFYTVIRDF